MILNCTSKLVRSIGISSLVSNRILTTNLLHSTVRDYFKYARNENGYFKEIYSDDLQFQQLDPIINDKRIVKDERISSFDNLVKTTNITGDNLKPFFKNFTDNLKGKDIASLLFVLNRLRESKFKGLNTSMHYLISYIDQALTEDLEKETSITNEKFEVLFQTALLFDEIGLQSWSKFINLLAIKPFESFELFENKENLLRLLYIWNLSRRQIDSDKALLVELQAVKLFHFNKFNLKECGILCLGFHKTQTKFQSNLIEKITEKLIKNIDSVDDPICLNSILKGIYSSDYKLERNLIDKLKERILESAHTKNDFMALTKLLAIEKKNRHFDITLINKILESFENQNTIRIKELSRLLLNLLYFDVQLTSKQIGKFNELFEHFKSNFAVYRVEYILSVYALASYGLIRKEEIYNIFEPEFIKILRSKYNNINYFLISLNNIVKLYGGVNYHDVALNDKDLMKFFKKSDLVTRQEIYERFKRFEHYPSKLYLTYQTIKESLSGRVFLIHLMPGIVIAPEVAPLKDYPFNVEVDCAKGYSIVLVPGIESYCDQEKRRLNGFFKLEIDLFEKMGFRLLNLQNHMISHNLNELRNYVKEEVIDRLDDNKPSIPL